MEPIYAGILGSTCWHESWSDGCGQVTKSYLSRYFGTCHSNITIGQRYSRDFKYVRRLILFWQLLIAVVMP